MPDPVGRDGNWLGRAGRPSGRAGRLGLVAPNITKLANGMEEKVNFSCQYLMKSLSHCLPWHCVALGE